MRFLSRALLPVSPERVDGLLSLCALDPGAGVTLAHQLLRWKHWGRGDVVAAGSLARPEAGAWATGSLIPFGLAPRSDLGHPGTTRDSLRAFADHAASRLTARGSIYGPAQDVEAIWPELSPLLPRVREARWNQPLLEAPSVTGGMAEGEARRRPELAWVAQSLRAAVRDEESFVLPASVAMFTEELGYDPLSSGSGYARHVGWLIAHGRSFVVFDDGAGQAPLPGGPREVLFKADVGAVWFPMTGERPVAQLTGVWTRPDQRGRGVARMALAATVDAVRRSFVGERGIVNLYVNDFNAPAVTLYRSLGFTQTGTFSTVLL